MLLVSAPALCCSTKMKSQFRNWSDIRVFLAVYRAGSTLAASKELGIAQPTVARRIEALEHELKLTLFERDTRGFRPTTEGNDLFVTATEVETAVNAFSSKAIGLKNLEAKVIRINSVPEVFSENFAAIIAEFSDAHPDVSFEFLATPANIDLSKGEADVAIRYANEIEDKTLICRKVSEAEGTLYASKSYAAKHGLPASEDDLAGHKFLALNTTVMARFTEWQNKHLTPDQIVMECSDFNGLMAAIHSGFGIGPMGVGIGDSNPSLVRCFPPLKEFTVPTWLLTSAAAHRRPEVRAFTKFFAPQYSKMLAIQRQEREAELARNASAT